MAFRNQVRAVACVGLAFFVACSGSSFSGSQGKKASSPKPAIKGDADADTDTLDQDEIVTDTTSTGTIATEEGIVAPQQCNQSTIQFISVGQDCPAHAAVYAADDAKTTQLTCCPLPARDILSLEAPQTRSGQCASGEVITGIVSERTYKCTKINAAKYTLSSVTPTCYVGSGAAGGDGSASCGAPDATMAAMATRYGSDACLGFPFGSLIVRNSGKDCRDISAVRLTDISGNPVVMYQP